MSQRQVRTIEVDEVLKRFFPDDYRTSIDGKVELGDQSLVEKVEDSSTIKSNGRTLELSNDTKPGQSISVEQNVKPGSVDSIDGKVDSSKFIIIL